MILWSWDDNTARWEPTLLELGQQAVLSGDARLVPRAGNRCALLAATGVKVNGIPALPLRLLGDRDEIRAGGRIFCLSLESMLEVRRFSPGEKVILCARCQAPLGDDEAVLACPRCRAAFHEVCWGYHSECARCRRSTTEPVWIPERLH